MRGVVARFVVVATLLAMPMVASAQTALSGVVKDGSGATLPGVTVEASSPVLIEKVRSATTDAMGLYRIPDLPPGVYKVTFAVQGFSTVVRENLELTGAGVITINADMRVGGVAETITVVGETPVIDVQTSTRRQVVLSTDVIQALPASRGYGNLLAAVPGIQSSGLDVSSGVLTNFFTARGGRGNEGTVQLDGMNVGTPMNGGSVSGFGYPIGESAEIQVSIAGGLGEVDRGGPAFNMIPKTGGNKFSGTAFGSVAGDWSQGDNIDDRLRGFDLTVPPALLKNWDTNFALGGPIVRDRLWFYNNVRSYGSHQEIPGLFANANAGDPTKWTYVRDQGVRGRSAQAKLTDAIRLTSQLTPKNKVGGYFDYQRVCSGSAFAKGAKQCRDRGDDWIALGSVVGGIGAVPSSPEAANVWDNHDTIAQGTWNSPLTNRVLLEAGVSQYTGRFGGYVPGGGLTDFIPVAEQSTLAGVPVPNFTYRGWASAGSLDMAHYVWRSAMTYVTGAHSMKVGYQAGYLVTKAYQNAGSQSATRSTTPIRFSSRCAMPRSGRVIVLVTTRPTFRTSGRASGSRCRAAYATNTRGAGFRQGRTAFLSTIALAAGSCSPSRRA